MSETASHRRERPRVLTVGAYERDNFGDLLFLLLTERYLSGSDVVAAAPFAADMTPLLDRQIAAVGNELNQRSFDAVWTVGGEVGGITTGFAYKMSKSPAEYAAYLAAAPAEQRKILRAALDGAPLLSPYLPTLGAFERNAGAVSVINSVGIAGAGGQSPHVREELLETFRTADVLSVRDRGSSVLLEQAGIPHTLTPDMVHAISLLEPYEPDPGSDVVVVQISTRLADRFGRERLARKLVESKHLAGMRIRLLLAGTATGHDSLDDIQEIAEHVRTLDSGREVEVLTDRRPLDIVRQIREAKIVIGTSLHVRIVAAAYGLPRITIRRAKPTKYATQWDDLMPFDVRGAHLEEAIGAALAAGQRPEVRAASEQLSRVADDNLRGIVERVGELVDRGHDAEREQLARHRQEQYAAVTARREACAVDTDRLRRQLAEARQEIEQLRAEAASAGPSGGWLRRRSAPSAG